jgi:hypothetical protein
MLAGEDARRSIDCGRSDLCGSIKRKIEMGND